MSAWVFDLEANGFLHVATKAHCGVFKNLETGLVRRFQPSEIPAMLKFMDTCATLMGHNIIGYDFPLLKDLYGYTFKGKKIDTLLMSRLQNPKRMLPFNCPNKKCGPHSVEAWGYRLGRGKPEHNDWENFSPAMLHRCSEDVEIQTLIYHALIKEGEGQNWDKAHLLTLKLFEILHEQEEYGWLVDRPYIDKCISMLTHFIRKIDAVLTPKLPLILVIEETKEKGGVYKYVKKPFIQSGAYHANTKKWMEANNIKGRSVVGPYSRVSFRNVDLSKNKETKEYLLAEGWIPDKWNYKKVDGKHFRDEDGQLVKMSPKLSHDDSFAGIQSGLGKMIAKRVQAKHRCSNIEGWIKLIREDGRISARVSGIAATGRAKHAGIVNVPGGDAFFGKQMRQCFIVKKGFKIVGTDSAGCQLRMLAARMGDAEYMDVIVKGDKAKGTDMHTINQKAAGLAMRSQAKTFIYGFLFGAGDAKIGDIVGGGAKEGKALKAEFLKGLPALGALIEKLTNEWKNNAKKKQVKTKWGWRTEYYNGWVIGLDGRPISIESEHMVLVYMLQSDEAIMMSAAYCLLYKRLISKGYKWGEDWAYICFYHDEYSLECREELAEEIKVIAEQAIVDAGKFFNIKCPHEGEGQIGDNWWDVH